jgi:hypothetical protein
MAVLEAIGNISRRASIGKPDATSDLELPVSVPILLEEVLPFRVVCQYSSSWSPYPSLSKRRRIPMSTNQTAWRQVRKPRPPIHKLNFSQGKSCTCEGNA